MREKLKGQPRTGWLRAAVMLVFGLACQISSLLAFAASQRPHDISPEAWTHMMAEVEARTYAVHPDKQHSDTWVADNPAQGLDASFSRNTVSFSARRQVGRGRASAPSARATSIGATFRLRTRVGNLSMPVVPVASGNRVEYRHPDYTEWFVNDAKGFEQGWTLNRRIGEGKPANLHVEVSGARTVAEGVGSVRIEDRDGKLRYRYAELRAWDADHRTIPATLRLKRAGSIDIALDDRGARYPITVDPTLTATRESVLSESVGGFGTTVAIDGDTVVVGAYGANNYEGQVFIFGRNQNGAGAWGLAATLNDPGSTLYDAFGSTVAIHGDTVAVSGLGPQAGSQAPELYIYERNLGGTGAWGLAYKVGDLQSKITLAGAYYLAVYGNTVIAGIGAVNQSGISGNVFIFDRNAGGTGKWGLSTTLNDPQNNSSDGYGNAVALHGSTLIVGAQFASNFQGQAYVYVHVPGSTSWQLGATLSNSQANSQFGQSVAVNGDTVVVGANSALNVYGRNQGGIAGSWGLEKTLSDPAANSSDSFGSAVALDGDFLTVGAQGTSGQGTAYLFERNQGGIGAWGLAATMSAPITGTNFGAVLGVSGDTLIVGIGSETGDKAYLYDLSGGTVSTDAAIADPSATTNDYFGVAVAVSGDTAVVGASNVSSNQGQVYVFERNQGGMGAWGLVIALSDPGAPAKDYFGSSVSVDGDTLVVEATLGDTINDGATYIYGRNKNGAGSWGLVQSIKTGGGGVTVNGSTLAFGANREQIYIFELNSSGVWVNTADLINPGNAGNNDNSFGTPAVALYGDTLIVGDPEGNGFQGAAYVYNRNQGGSENWGIVATFLDPTSTTGDEFGSSVAVNGGTAVVGAPGYTSAQGRAYIYGDQASGWVSIATLQDPKATNDDSFGSAVAVSGDTIVVGSEGFGGSGAAYIFNRNQGGSNAWGLTATQTDPGAAANDYFGNAVAVDGETAVIGAIQANNTKGSAYINSVQQGTGAKDASIVWYNTNGQVVLWNMNGSAIASAPGLGTVPAGWSIVGTADFNGDGNPDLLWRNTSGAVVLWLTNGSAVTSSLNLGTIPTSWTVAGTGDFNGDGNADILWRNSGGDTVIWFMNGSGIGSSSDLGTIATSWTVAGTGDFNDDGKADILWRNSSGDDVIWFMNAGSIASSSDLGVIASTWKVVGTGDFNGDGYRDILWRNSNGELVIWFMNGGTISSSKDFGVVALAWSVAGTGDFDGNGKTDILWRNSNGDTVIWFMNGATVASSADLGVITGGWSVAGVAGH